ncbi:MAG: hypothetical protein WDM94_05835 [Bauldia sp.]
MAADFGDRGADDGGAGVRPFAAGDPDEAAAPVVEDARRKDGAGGVGDGGAVAGLDRNAPDRRGEGCGEAVEVEDRQPQTARGLRSEDVGRAEIGEQRAQAFGTIGDRGGEAVDADVGARRLAFVGR